MKLTIVSDNVIGSQLAVPIYNGDGILAINSGMNITDKVVNYIKRLGINTIYIHDGFDEITLQDVIDSGIRLSLLKTLKAEFNSIKTKKWINESVISRVVENIISNVNLSENAFLYNNIGYTDDEIALVNHSIDVAILSIIVGANNGYDQKKLFSLGVGALLHDIGKLFTSEEDHTLVGYKLAKSNVFFTPTMCVPILQHHENKDGSGFPEKIYEDKIYEFSKIVSICNEYIVQSNSHKGLLPHEIMEHITTEATKRFDFEIFKKFNDSIHCYPNGLTIELNNGLKGIVIMQNKNFPLRPIIMVNKNDNERAYINLMDILTLFISKVII